MMLKIHIFAVLGLVSNVHISESVFASLVENVEVFNARGQRRHSARF